MYAGFLRCCRAGTPRRMSSTWQIRVMSVDDHLTMREGLRRMLEESGDYGVAGQDANRVAAVTRAG